MGNGFIGSILSVSQRIEMTRMVLDEFTLTYPGIKNVEREYFYACGADDAQGRPIRNGAYLGRQFRADLSLHHRRKSRREAPTDANCVAGSEA
jgi:hypothetical protein